MPSYDEIFEELKDIYLKVFGDVFGVEVGEPENWTEAELKIFEELEKVGTNEEYILSRTPERAFKEMPTGSALGYEFVKVKGGPLIRAYVLRKDDTIEKIMYTGTMQLAPPIALEEIEKELKDCKIDEKLISEKIVGVWERLNIMLGMGSSALVADVTMRAGKASYENPIKTA
jgi:hypothetical protein